MIEINLLPVELRQAEGTPLPRLMTILGGALAGTLGVVLVANYYIIDIPNTRERTRLMAIDLKKKQEEKKEVDRIDAEIRRIQAKVDALKNLERNRIRWARLLDIFSKSVPDGCVVSSFRVAPEGRGQGAGRRFKISIDGLTTGDTYPDCVNKLAIVFFNNLKKEFEVGEHAKRPPPGAGKKGGPKSQYPPLFNEFLGLRFEEPVILPYGPAKPPKVSGPPRGFRQPVQGLKYKMDIRFVLPPPV